jgi:hypothetical protein
MVTYNTVLEDRQYREISKRAARYYQERGKMVDLPLIKTEIPDADQYRWVRLTDPRIAAEEDPDIINVGPATGGVREWEESGDLADIQHGYTDYSLGSIQMNLKIINSNINQFVGSNLLADKRDALIAKFAVDVDDGLIKGIYDRTGQVCLATGYQAQATSVVDLNGVDSNLSTKGDIWKGINKMIDAIPFAMREEGPPMVLLMSENIAKNAKAPDRIYQDKLEWDFIYENLIGPMALEGRKIGTVRVTNKILVSGTDTLGTNDRMALYVPDRRWLAKVVSRSFSLLGEKRGMLSVIQGWGWKGRCIIDNADAAQFTEQIVWV